MWVYEDLSLGIHPSLSWTICVSYPGYKWSGSSGEGTKYQLSTRQKVEIFFVSFLAWFLFVNFFFQTHGFTSSQTLPRQMCKYLQLVGPEVRCVIYHWQKSWKTFASARWILLLDKLGKACIAKHNRRNRKQWTRWWCGYRSGWAVMYCRGCTSAIRRGCSLSGQEVELRLWLWQKK